MSNYTKIKPIVAYEDTEFDRGGWLEVEKALYNVLSQDPEALYKVVVEKIEVRDETKD